MQLVLEIVWGALVVLCSLVTLFSLLPGKLWWLRVCDFPRAQVLITSLCLLGVELIRIAAGGENGNDGWSSVHVSLVILLLFSLICQAWWAYLLTPVAKKEVAAISPAPDDNSEITDTGRTKNQLRIIAANVDYTNEYQDDAMDRLLAEDPDVIALIEPDDQWQPMIKQAQEQLPHCVQELRELGRGMALLSRFPLEDPRVEYLVDNDRPSIWAHIRLPSDETVRLVVTHPPPPGLPKRRDEGRHSSRTRDIELDIIAGIIRDDPDHHWVLTGDFNDVGWSATTLRAKRESGLLDPRVGRGTYNTFPASWPFLRYPIDHVLVSPSFRLAGLDRLENIGSDHLPLLADLIVFETRPAGA